MFNNKYRENIFSELNALQQNYNLVILSGDEDYEEEKLRKELGNKVVYKFNQTPFDKKNYIALLQKQGKTVCMFGDGLNDAGALKQSDAGISIIENVGSFSPASDIIIQSSQLGKLKQLFNFAADSLKLLKFSLIFSLFYNVIGLSFAVTGNLTPLVAAILMPLSSVSVVGFVTLGIYFLAAKHHLK